MDVVEEELNRVGDFRSSQLTPDFTASIQILRSMVCTESIIEMLVTKTPILKHQIWKDWANPPTKLRVQQGVRKVARARMTRKWMKQDQLFQKTCCVDKLQQEMRQKLKMRTYQKCHNLQSQFKFTMSAPHQAPLPS